MSNTRSKIVKLAEGVWFTDTGPKVGGPSPWGSIQSVVQFAEGIWFVETAGHGGFVLSDERAEEMPPQLLPEGRKRYFFEEDCEYGLVIVAFPQFWSSDTVAKARNTVKNWFPDQWERFTGEKLTGKDSFIRAKEEFFEKHADDWVAFSCVTMPLGMNLVVYCRRGKDVESRRGEEKRFIVPVEEYRLEREHFGFIVDPSRHPEHDPTKGDPK